MDLTQFISITPSKKQCPEISKDAPTVCGLTHLSRATIYRMVARGDFPKPFSVFGRKLWLEQDVLDWLSASEQSLLKQIEKRRGHGKAKGEQITEEAAL